MQDKGGVGAMVGWKVLKFGWVLAWSNSMPPRVEALGSFPMERYCRRMCGSCWRGRLSWMLWEKAPKAGMVGADWVSSQSCMSAKQVVISMMSAMWLLLWG